jgi:bla regulator protein blaR1
MKAMPLVLAGLLIVASQAAAQPSVNTPEFEVASIRVNRDRSDRPTLMRPILQKGGRVLMTNQTLRDLILTAYGVRENELIGGPDWIRSTGFDLEARGTPDMSAETAREMLRTLLAERFSLVVHREQRDLSIYVLTMAIRNGQPGPRLRPADAQCAPVTPPKGMPPPPSSPPKGIMEAVPLMLRGTPRGCPSMFMAGHFSARSITMDVLATELAEAVRRPVVNRTGLIGEFDLDVNYAPDLDTVAAPETATAPTLTTALREQLGLKLEGDRGPVDVLVIDRALMPTEN